MKIKLYQLLSFLICITSLSFIVTDDRNYITKSSSIRIQCFTCGNCRNVIYREPNDEDPYPPKAGCPKSWWSHSWSYQGILGNRLFYCKKCKIKITLESSPANITSNCRIHDEDELGKHDFIEIR